MSEQPLPPPVPAEPSRLEYSVVSSVPPPPAHRSALGWVIAGLVGLVLSGVGGFLGLVTVGGRSVELDDIGVGVALPWSARSRVFGLTLFERWDIAVVLLLCAAALAVVVLAAPALRWPAAVGAVLAALAFHLQLSIVERAEVRALQRMQTPSYSIGAVLMIGGALLGLVSFVVVLLRRR